MSKNREDRRAFEFKQFRLFHHNSTMKVGTDANLLGIWADMSGVKSAIDVGSGCGIIALLIASRSEAMVDGIELEANSANEASENFRSSDFHERLNMIHGNVNAFSRVREGTYDLVISNPPFFVNCLRSNDLKCSNARHADTLSYEQLCESAQSLLKKSGRFCVVLPYDGHKRFQKIAADFGFMLYRKMIIFPKRGLAPNRINLDFRFQLPRTPIVEQFIIREEDNSYTSQFDHFVKDYYLED